MDSLENTPTPSADRCCAQPVSPLTGEKRHHGTVSAEEESGPPETLIGVELWVEAYLDRLYRFAYRLTGSGADAEDLVQETFLIACRKRDQLRESEKALPWLLKILRRCAMQLRERRPPTVAVTEPEELMDPESVSLVEEVDSERLAQVLERLPVEYREPLLLFYFEDLKYRDIAAILDCPIGTVMSRLARAKAHLRTELEAQGCV